MKFVVILFFSLGFCFHNSLAFDDTLKPNQTLRDTGQTLVSSGKKFKLGFFNLQNSENRYVGIWFNNIPTLTAVWVANRDNPLTDSSGILKITESGNILIVSNKTEDPVWSSHSSAKDPTLQLLSTGNLVVKDGDSGNYAWQSFDHPCDSLIAGMKLGWDFRTGQNWKLNSWNNLEDPSTGIYTYEMDRNGIPQDLLLRDQDIVYRNGPWDGVRSGGYPTPMREQSLFIPNYVVNETHNYYSFDNADDSTLTRFYLNALGSPTQERWDHTSARWVLAYAVQKEDCDTFARCGPNGICVENGCDCPTGFVPKSSVYSSSGCILKTSLNCSANEGFKKFSKLKLPYNSEFTVNGTVVEKEECELICRRNCSCVAYAVAKVGGCVVWSGELFDMIRFSVGGQDVYIRMDASELKSDENEKKRAVIIAVSVVSGFVLLFLVGVYIIRKRRVSRSHISQFDNAATNSNEHKHPILLEEDVDQLPSFGLDIIATATNNFSSTNKIGEGGFGPVYKGMLPTGQKIAVKRLSKDSRQGLVEFKNEVVLIAKLQHWNLVRLLGCFIQGEERMLIYEYMPNKSLDLYIFNQTRGTALDWPKRFDIIVGVARGLLYLHRDSRLRIIHRDSRLRIIHRDLKASNILLDDEMNPKISDFGMARIFGGDQNEVNTKRVVGTYGYMSPEYVIDGHFSVKSDIFSFGVMVLEIVSGKKNRGFEHPDHEHNLLGHAWNLWNSGRPMELMDSLMENISVSEVLRCIQVGLLCVQKRPEERPLMSFALSMLDSENASLPQPKQPGFYTERAFVETDSSSLLKKPNASTEITVTILEGR